MRNIRIFLGGGVKLLRGENEFLKGYRNDVIDPILSQLNSKEFAKHLFIAKDFSDLTRNVVKGKHQEVYNRYIVEDAQIALFIIDGVIGNITKHEIDVAVSSTKKAHHPLVYIYGKNVREDSDILEYLNQEGIYFQHFFDNRDLAAKIKDDLENAAQRFEQNRSFRFLVSLLISLALCCGVFMTIKKFNNATNEENVIDYCSAQLNLMRYYDINAITGSSVFTDKLLSNFMYEDSCMTGNDRSVFPIFNSDSLIITTPPFFRIKLYNSHRNTIVLVEAKLEVENYVSDSTTYNTSFNQLEQIPNVDIIKVDGDGSEYLLKGFRRNLVYGEPDDKYFFSIVASENCSFRMRVRVKSNLGDYLYSNYIYVKYVR